MKRYDKIRSELGHERNNYYVMFKGSNKFWKVFKSKKRAEAAAATLRKKGKEVSVGPTAASVSESTLDEGILDKIKGLISLVPSKKKDTDQGRLAAIKRAMSNDPEFDKIVRNGIWVGHHRGSPFTSARWKAGYKQKFEKYVIKTMSSKRAKELGFDKINWVDKDNPAGRIAKGTVGDPHKAARRLGDIAKYHALKSYDSRKEEHQMENINQLDEAKVNIAKKRYSWGTMTTIKKGNSFSVPIHPKDMKTILDIADKKKGAFRDETGDSWSVERRGDLLQFTSMGRTVAVERDDLKESLDLSEYKGSFRYRIRKKLGFSPDSGDRDEISKIGRQAAADNSRNREERKDKLSAEVKKVSSKASSIINKNKNYKEMKFSFNKELNDDERNAVVDVLKKNGFTVNVAKNGLINSIKESLDLSKYKDTLKPLKKEKPSKAKRSTSELIATIALIGKLNKDLKDPKLSPTKRKKIEREIKKLNKEVMMKESETLGEGTWAVPETPEDYKKLAKLLSKPLKVRGKESDKNHPAAKLYGLLGDDELFDDLGELEQGEDARPTIINFLKKNAPQMYKKVKAAGLREDVEQLDEVTLKIMRYPDDYKKIAKLLSRPMRVRGHRGDKNHPAAIFFSLLGNPGLFDDLGKLEQGEDARPTVIAFLKNKAPQIYKKVKAVGGLRESVEQLEEGILDKIKKALRKDAPKNAKNPDFIFIYAGKRWNPPVVGTNDDETGDPIILAKGIKKIISYLKNNKVDPKSVNFYGDEPGGSVSDVAKKHYADLVKAKVMLDDEPRYKQTNLKFESVEQLDEDIVDKIRGIMDLVPTKKNRQERKVIAAIKTAMSNDPEFDEIVRNGILFGKYGTKWKSGYRKKFEDYVKKTLSPEMAKKLGFTTTNWVDNPNKGKRYFNWDLLSFEKDRRNMVKKGREGDQYRASWTMADIAKKHAQKTRKESVEQIEEKKSPVNYTLGNKPDKDYLYQIIKNGEPLEGDLYHSLGDAKRVLGNKKKTNKIDKFKINRVKRNKLAGPKGKLPEEFEQIDELTDKQRAEIAARKKKREDEKAAKKAKAAENKAKREKSKGTRGGEGAYDKEDDHVIMQFRKAQDVDGNMDIKFGRNKTGKVSKQDIDAVLSFHDKLSKPDDKRRMRIKLAKGGVAAAKQLAAVYRKTVGK